ncbi:MAG: phage tail protein [Taibaiella sp.]|nr:phage tail protein [Taibaiella sp.]
MEPFLGLIQPMAFSYAPVGWMTCQGQLMSIAENTALFSLLGTTYGGDGQTTFALPDLRGRVIVSPGSAAGLPSVDWGEVGGSPYTTLLSVNLPAHNHPISVVTNQFSANTNASVNNYFGGSGPNAYEPTPDSAMNTGAVLMGVSGANVPVDVMNPYVAMNYNIAIEGIYPSRN